MFKQSHIALSAYLAKELPDEEIKQYRRSLCLGSVDPDLKPKLRAKSHEFEETWEDTKELIRRLETADIGYIAADRAAVREIGMVLHYLSDYFTCPHNPSYALSFTEHFVYEGRQQLLMRAYLHDEEAREQVYSQRKIAAGIHGADELISHIERMHGLYLEEEEHSPGSDCRWIVGLCACTFMVLTSMVFAGAEEEWLHDSVA